MDYNLRQLRKRAVEENTLQSWQAYASALERTIPGSREPQRSLVVHGIDWWRHHRDEDEESPPQIVVFHTADEDLLDAAFSYHDDVIEEVAEILSNHFGFAVNAFNYQVTDCINLDE